MIKNQKTLFILYNSIACIVLITIIYLSLTSRPVSLNTAKNFDKIQHGAAYAVLAYFFYLALKSWGIGKWAGFLTLVLCSITGGGLEIIQSQYGRMMELNDFIADFGGAVAGLIIVRIRSGVFR